VLENDSLSSSPLAEALEAVRQALDAADASPDEIARVLEDVRRLGEPGRASGSGRPWLRGSAADLLHALGYKRHSHRALNRLQRLGQIEIRRATVPFGRDQFEMRVQDDGRHDEALRRLEHYRGTG
jgi:hypothetical protein